MPHVDLPQAEFKVVMLGDTFTGKTSLVLRFAEGYYRESARSATVGANFITKRLTVPSVGLTCKIQIWDTAGQEQFKPLAPMYYSNSAAAILCYDPASTQSLHTLKYWVEELHRNLAAGQIVIAMAACKCDLLKENSNPANAQVAVANLHQIEALAAQMGAIFVATSAKNNENVAELFTLVAERVLHSQRNNKSTNGSSTVPTTTLGGGSNTNNNNTSKGRGIAGPVSRPDSALPGYPHRARSANNLRLTLPAHSNSSGSRPSSPQYCASDPSGMNVNRDDYLHRRSHHPDGTTANHENNNVSDPGSPARRRWTDPSKMDGSPITIRDPTTTPPGARLSGAAAICGDAEYLNCAGIPTNLYTTATAGMDQSQKCVIS